MRLSHPWRWRWRWRWRWSQGRLLQLQRHYCCFREMEQTHSKSLLSSTSVANSTLSLYFKHRQFDAGLGLFHAMTFHDSVSWNIVVHGFLHSGCFLPGLRWFRLARRFPTFEPNVSTLVLLLMACFELGARGAGEMLHGYLIRSGSLSVLSVQNSLLRFYSALGCSAEKLFGEMPHRDVVSWSVMIGGHVKSGNAAVALAMFKEMFSQPGNEPDGVVLVTVFNACTKLQDLRIGEPLHGLAVRRGLDGDLFVQNSLIDMYSKNGEAGTGFKVFYDMPARNLVSWNSMLSGFVQNEEFDEAATLVHSMAEEGIGPDNVTLVNVLQLAKHLAHPYLTKLVHCFIIRRGCDYNELVSTTLTDAYTNCDLVELAWEVFVRMKRKDVVSWSTMIAGFARCGKPEEAVAVFREMNAREVIANAVTITNLLDACTISAQLKKSKWAHGIAVRWGLAPDVAVGTAIVDMYSKCGDIEASRRAFEQIPCKNVVTWSAMIAGCAMNGLATEATDLLGKMKLFGLKPNAITILSVLAACSHSGLVEEGLGLFTWMVEEGEAEAGPEHYSCMVDMLARAGMLGIALDLMERIPAGKGSASARGALLSACRNNVGDSAVPHILELEPTDSGGYVLRSSMHASLGSWADVARMRGEARERRVKVGAGYSLLDAGERVHRFVAGDRSHPKVGALYGMVKQLHGDIKTLTLPDT